MHASYCAAPHAANVGHVLFLVTYPQRADTLAVDAIVFRDVRTVRATQAKTGRTNLSLLA